MKTPNRSFSFISVACRPQSWRAVLLAGIALFAGSLACAQGSGSANLSGRVTDGVNLVALAGARVSLVGASFEEITDAAGNYTFPPLPPGRYQLRVDYLGFSPVTMAVDLTGGAAVSRNITLGSDIVLLDAFRVTGSAEGQAKALNQQKNADNIKNIVASDALGEFPDNFVADALQRLPGIAIDRDQGEGRNVVIRGIEAAYNNVLIDGQRAPGYDRKDPRFELDTLSVSLVDSVEISKTVTPDMDAAAIGGTVNIKTPSAFSRGGRALWGSVRYGHNELGGGNTYQGSLTVSDIFGAKRNLGVLLSANVQDTKRQTDDQEEQWALVPGTTADYYLNRVELRDYQITRRRQGYAANLDYKLSPDSSVYLRSQYSMFRDNELRPGLQLNLGSRVTSNAAGGTTTGGDARRLLQNTKKDKKQFTVLAGGETRLAGSVLTYSAARSHSVQDMKQDDAWEFRQTGINFSYDLGDLWFPRATVTNGKNINDAGAFLFNNVRVRPEIVEANETVLRADWLRPQEFAGRPGALKFGGKFSRSDRFVNQWTTTYSKVGSGFPLAAIATTEHRPDFLEGRYNFGPVVDPARGVAYLAANPALSTTAFTDNSTDDYTTNEDVLSAYGMATIKLGRASVLGGVRVEHTTTKYDASQLVQTGSVTTPAPLHAKLDYTQVMPGVHLRFVQTDRLVWRAAWTNTIARPKFEDVTPASQIDTAKRTISTGNPKLKSAESLNFDLSGEYYLKPLGIVSAGVFYKHIADLAFDTVTNVTNPAGLPAGIYQLTQKENADAARLIGLELSWQQQLKFLPAPLDGLSFGANYTRTDGDVKAPTRPGVKLRLFKQSRNIANLFLGYRRGPFETRLSWVYRSSQFIKLGADANLDFYSDPSWRADFTASYKLSRRLSLFGDVLNLTNDPFTRYQGIVARPIQNEQYGRTYSLGLRWSL